MRVARIVAGLAPWLLAAHAHAGKNDGRPVRLSVTRDEGAESCPDAREVARLVRARLGRNPFTDDARETAEVIVTRKDASFVARIRVRGDGGALLGERTIT